MLLLLFFVSQALANLCDVGTHNCEQYCIILSENTTSCLCSDGFQSYGDYCIKRSIGGIDYGSIIALQMAGYVVIFICAAILFKRRNDTSKITYSIMQNP